MGCPTSSVERRGQCLDAGAIAAANAFGPLLVAHATHADSPSSNAHLPRPRLARSCGDEGASSSGASGIPDAGRWEGAAPQRQGLGPTTSSRHRFPRESSPKPRPLGPTTRARTPFPSRASSKLLRLRPNYQLEAPFPSRASSSKLPRLRPDRVGRAGGINTSPAPLAGGTGARDTTREAPTSSRSPRTRAAATSADPWSRSPDEPHASGTDGSAAETRAGDPRRTPRARRVRPSARSVTGAAFCPRVRAAPRRALLLRCFT